MGVAELAGHFAVKGLGQLQNLQPRLAYTQTCLGHCRSMLGNFATKACQAAFLIPQALDVDEAFCEQCAQIGNLLGIGTGQFLLAGDHGLEAFDLRLKLHYVFFKNAYFPGQTAASGLENLLLVGHRFPDARIAGGEIGHWQGAVVSLLLGLQSGFLG